MVIKARSSAALLPSLRNRALSAVPFAFLLFLGILQFVTGPGHGFLVLMAVSPAIAAALGGELYTTLVGAAALGEEALFSVSLQPAITGYQTEIALLTITGVTVMSALTSRARRHRERDLIEVRAIADVTQRVLLRPVPESIGPVQLSARYLSALSHAQVGGDLYAVVPTGKCLRLIVGDVEGKGLPAVEQAAAAMDAFRVAARVEDTLSEVAAGVEAALRSELGEEQFITAILAEVSQDNHEIEMLNCGHPQPLRLGPKGPELLGPADGGLPLGLGPLGAAPRVPFIVRWEAGEPILFYTDGLTEARDKAGKFFSPAGSAAIRDSHDPRELVGKLSDEVIRYVAQRPHDDIAMLLVWREDNDAGTWPG